MVGGKSQVFSAPSSNGGSATSFLSDLRRLEGKLTFHCDAYQRGVILCFVSGMTHDLQRNNTMDDVNMPSIVLPSLVRALQPQDIIVVNAGLHWGVEGAEMITRSILSVWQSIRNAAAKTQRTTDPATLLPALWWRETAPQHFPGEGTYSKAALDAARVQKLCSMPDQNEYNSITTAIMEEFGLPIVRLWNMTTLFSDAHYASKGDCTHFCQGHAGPYPLWTVALKEMIDERGPKMASARMDLTRSQRLYKIWNELYPESLAALNGDPIVQCCSSKAGLGKIPEITISLQGLSDEMVSYISRCCPFYPEILSREAQFPVG